jgi:hypothetical protein
MRAHTSARRRARLATGIALAGLLVLAAGSYAVWRDARLDARPDASGPVLADWQQNAAQARVIEIEGPDGSLRLERGPASQSGWVMADRGGYPVPPERVAELDAALSQLSYSAAMTQDPDKFSRLGLVGAAEGGQGVRLTVRSADDTRLADLIIGADRGDDGLFMRIPGNGQAYAAQGRLPDLDAVDHWLGLDFFNLDPASVARVRVQPETGEAYALAKAGMSARNFELREPRGWRLITSGAANGVAVAGARMRFRDVRPQECLIGAPVAAHAAVTFDGLAYSYTVFDEGGRHWARLEITAAADDAEARAQRLDAVAGGWAFEVSDDAYERLTRPLDQIAERF